MSIAHNPGPISGHDWLSYSTSQANDYFYKLEFVDQTVDTYENETMYILHNLSPGKYILHLRATTSRHTGKHPICDRSLTIVILPPWYASTWAYIIYALLGICAFGGWFY